MARRQYGGDFCGGWLFCIWFVGGKVVLVVVSVMTGLPGDGCGGFGGDSCDTDAVVEWWCWFRSQKI